MIMIRGAQQRRAEGDDWGRPYPSGDWPLLFMLLLLLFSPVAAYTTHEIKRRRRSRRRRKREKDGLYLIIFRFAGGALLYIYIFFLRHFNIKGEELKKKKKLRLFLCWMCCTDHYLHYNVSVAKSPSQTNASRLTQSEHRRSTKTRIGTCLSFIYSLICITTMQKSRWIDQ